LSLGLVSGSFLWGCGSPYYVEGQDQLGELPDSLRIVIEQRKEAEKAKQADRAGRKPAEGVFVREVGEPAAEKALPLEYLPESSYLLRRGDRLEIKVLFYPELTATTTVRPDGMITAPGMGDVLALGRTPGEVAADVETYYGGLLRNPETTVNVLDFGQRRAYVFGEVEKPGPVDLEQRMTITQALAATGSPTAEAKVASVVLLRRKSEKTAQAYRLDLRGVLDGKSLAADVVLQPDDVVFVPKSFVASMATFVDQLFEGLQPIPDLIIKSYDAINVEDRIPARR
jgi:protein involved in polysaccharide export with SLBB domain